jgi:integrase/recombinase XerD
MTLLDSQVISDSQAIGLFLDMLRAEKGSAKNTTLAYARDLKMASGAIAESLMAATSASMRDYFALLHAQGLARTSLSRKRATLRQFYKFLVSEKYISTNPMFDILATLPQRALPKTLDEDMMRKFFTTLAEKNSADPCMENARLQLCVELLYGAGLRATEVMSLPRSALVAGRDHMIITGKGTKQRLVPLNESVQSAAKNYLTFVPESSRYLFPAGANNQGLSSHMTRIRLYQLIKELAVEAGINPAKVSPHILRHAFATHLLEGGADLRSVQQLLGHADIGTTQIYTHVTTGHLQRTVFEKHPLAIGAFDKLNHTDEGRS